MINLPENHSDPLVIGVGAHRACYIHPEDPHKCIWTGTQEAGQPL